MDSGLMTVGEAREYLQISSATMAKLIKAGHLPFTRDLLDARIRLVKRTDVETIAAQSARPRKTAA